MSIDNFGPEIEALRDRFAALVAQSQSVPDERRDLLEQAFEEFYTALEELRVTTEELTSAQGQVDIERQRYQDLFEFAPDGYLVTDQFGAIREANRAATELLNARREFLAGKPLRLYVAVEERHVFQQALMQLLEVGRIDDWTVSLEPTGRERLEVALSASVVLEGRDGEPMLRWLVRDVTERRQAEREIRRLNVDLEERVAERTAELEEANRQKDSLLIQERAAREAVEATQRRLALLADVGALLVGTVDRTKRLTEIARRALPYFGDWCEIFLFDGSGQVRREVAVHRDPAKDAVIGTLSAEFIPDLTGIGDLSTALRSQRSLSFARLDDQMIDSLGSCSRDLETLRQLSPKGALVVPLRIGGHTFGAIAFVSETELTVDAATRELAEELAGRVALAIENDRLYRQAQDAVRVRDEFLSVASHELKTPLTTVKGCVQLLERQLRFPTLERERLVDLTERLDEQVGRFEVLITDLLDVSRIHMGHVDLRLERVDLGSLASQVVERFEYAAERLPTHRLVLHVDGSIAGRWDPGRLDQVLTNLISNALKYSPDGGQVDVAVRTSEDQAYAEFVVEDKGIGISDEQLPSLFEPFKRLDTTHHSVGGSGLGLYITAHIVERHGGTIAVESKVGRGSRFTVRLPLAGGVK